MLTYSQALAQILKATPHLKPTTAKLGKAQGLILAQPIQARRDLPRFDNAAVDGYAINFAKRNLSIEHLKTLRVIGRSEAGNLFRGVVPRGQAVRIFTGAMVPRGANTVIMQEQVQRHGSWITLLSAPEEGRHIRRQGEDLRRGKQVLAQGTLLRAQELALLAALGIPRIRVYPKPTVAILATGDELRPPGARLKSGEIYESNGVLLDALLREAGACPVRLGIARDVVSSLIRKIRKGLGCDVLLICGGASVGEKDFVRRAAGACGVTEIFWKVNIKPGMPLFFGRHNQTLVFGLPGNPVSVFVTFEEFVKPALSRLLGRPWNDGYNTPATLARDLKVSTTRHTHFIRVRCVQENSRILAVPLDGQGSHQLHSLVQAGGWIRMMSDQSPWPAGTAVLVKRKGLG